MGDMNHTATSTFFYANINAHTAHIDDDPLWGAKLHSRSRSMGNSIWNSTSWRRLCRLLAFPRAVHQRPAEPVRRSQESDWKPAAGPRRQELRVHVLREGVARVAGLGLRQHRHPRRCSGGCQVTALGRTLGASLYSRVWPSHGHLLDHEWLGLYICIHVKLPVFHFISYGARINQ